MIGDRISQLIKAQRIEKSRLCEELSIARGTLDNWIKGTSFPDASEIQRLSKVLNVSVGELYGEKPDYQEKLIQAQESTIADLKEELKKVWQHVDQLVTKIPDAKS